LRRGDVKEYDENIPVQYQEGKAPFMGMDIMVDPRVLIPRPETELLVRTAARFLLERGDEAPYVLEIGTGSGIIPLGMTRLVPGCRVLATDISEDALEVSRKNIEMSGPPGAIELLASDMFSSLGGGFKERFDCVISNPPYVSDRDYRSLDAWVKAEPPAALRAGPEGMDHLEVIASESADFIKPGGFVAAEVGYDQAEKMKSLLVDNGFKEVGTHRDLNGYERVITGWKNG